MPPRSLITLSIEGLADSPPDRACATLESEAAAARILRERHPR